MKEYVKPELYYESFELSQHIAGCNLQMLNTIETACAASGTIDGIGSSGAWFVNGIDACMNWVQDFCYTNSEGSLTTINS